MTAKDKAKELFDKYCHAIRTEECDDGYFTNVVHAKRCAIIAVDEILWMSSHYVTIQFWENVKIEIEKL
jgi:hypothetical protein